MPVVELLTRITPMVLGLDHVDAEQTHLLTTPRHEPRGTLQVEPHGQTSLLGRGPFGSQLRTFGG